MTGCQDEARDVTAGFERSVEQVRAYVIHARLVL